jgi:hypothetical protein
VVWVCPGFLELGLESLECALDSFKVGLALGQLVTHEGEIVGGALEYRFFGLQYASFASEDDLGVLFGLSECELGVFAQLALMLDFFDKTFDMVRELFLSPTVCVDFFCVGLVCACHLL